MNWLYPNQVNKIRPDYFENYTGVVEGLMNQGLTLKQIEGTVVGNRLWRGWRRDVKALHLVDDIIVDMILIIPTCSGRQISKTLSSAHRRFIRILR